MPPQTQSSPPSPNGPQSDTSAASVPMTRLYVLAVILFVSYLTVAMALPVVPLFVVHDLGLSNALAGTAVGIAFLSTIVTRGYAGALCDKRGPKLSMGRGLIAYAAGSLICLAAGLSGLPVPAAFALLAIGRLVIGLGESMTAVGVIAWGIGIVGPARSGKVLAMVGAALYGAFAIGAPIGLMLSDHLGFSGLMLASTVLPLLGLLAIRGMPGVAGNPHAARPPMIEVIGRIWRQGAIVCLQGIGFAGLGAFFSLYFVARGWDNAGLGLTAFGAGFVLVRFLFGHLPDKLGGLPVAIGSLAIETVGQLVIWQAEIPSLALLGAFLTGLGCSMIFPAMGRDVVHRVPQHLRGTALGAFSAFQDLAYGLTGPLVGLMIDRAGYSVVFLLGTVAAALGLLLALSVRRKAALSEA
jgi:MFS family permease